MNKDKKTFVNGQAHILSCLAAIAAISANVLMFYTLAMVRSKPSLNYLEQYETMRIITLDLPAQTTDEPTNQETIMDVIQLNPEPTDTEQPQPDAKMTSSTIPRLAERIYKASFKLPGIPINPSNMSLLKPAMAAPIGSVEQPISAPKVDRLPSKITGPLPRYPQWARRDNLEAMVILRFIVTAEGTVEDININEIEGDERFGREAIQAISQWRFSPAIRAGKSVPCWCFQKINFKFSR